jgi:hypothetical protein
MLLLSDSKIVFNKLTVLFINGATVIPWSKGQRLIWDVTCVDALADSYMRKCFALTILLVDIWTFLLKGQTFELKLSGLTRIKMPKFNS